jgi:L-aspartate oxidase
MWGSCELQKAPSRREAHRNLQQEIHEYYWDFLVTSDLLELRNIATVAELIVRSALARHESRGLHYNLEYSNPDPDLAQQNTLLRREF